MGIAHILYLLSGIFIIIMEFSDIHILTFITLRQIQHFVKSLSLFTQATHTSVSLNFRYASCFFTSLTNPQFSSEHTSLFPFCSMMAPHRSHLSSTGRCHTIKSQSGLSIQP